MKDVTLLLLVLLIGIPLCTLTFFVCRRLRELHNTHNVIEGELFVSDSGEIYSQFGIQLDEIVKRDYILLQVHHVNNKKEEKENVQKSNK